MPTTKTSSKDTRLPATTASFTVTVSAGEQSVGLTVVDLGTTRLYVEDVSAPTRCAYRAEYDPARRQIEVQRDCERSVLGHALLPAAAPLTQDLAEHIAGAVIADYLTGGSTSVCFTTDETTYYDGVAEAIEHPTWCERSCWKPGDLGVRHESKPDVHEWEHDSVEHTAALSYIRHGEHITPYPTEDFEQAELRIESSELGDVTLIGRPEHFTELGRFLIDASARLTETVAGEGDS